MFQFLSMSIAKFDYNFYVVAYDKMLMHFFFDKVIYFCIVMNFGAEIRKKKFYQQMNEINFHAIKKLKHQTNVKLYNNFPNTLR